MEGAKPEGTTADVPNDGQSAWGSVDMKEPTPEQIEEARKMQWLQHARAKLANPRMHPQERKTL